MVLADLIKIPTVQAYLMDGSVMTVFEAILEKFALDKGRAIELLDLTDAVLEEQLTLQDIPAMMQQAFGVEEERAIRLSCDVVGFRLLPLEEHIPGVVAQLTAWGADMSKYPKSRVGKQKLLPETFAAQLDEQLDLNFSEVLVKRAGFLIHSYWKGEKTKESTLTFFSRATTIGGLGLSPEQSQALLNAVDQSRDLVELVPGISGEVPPVLENSGEVAVKEIEKQFETQGASSEVQEERGGSSKEIEIAPSHEVAASVPVINSPRRREDDADLAEARSTARRLAMTQDDVSLDRAVQQAVENARALIETHGIPEATFSDVIRKALKGVRDLYQTRDVFLRDLKLDGAALEQATEILEAAHRSVHTGSLLPATPSLPTSEVPKQDVVLDQRFSAIAQDSPGEHLEPVLPSARVSLARTPEEERAKQAAAIPQEKLAQAAVASRPAPVKPMLTVGSVAPAKQARPMTDVQPVRRLMGPVDELGALSPAEFRRLSTVPADAVQKIEDMLSTLEQHSYEERVRGIAAWRKSPMNQLYIAMTTAALMEGVAVAEIAAKRRGAGEESLSPAEIRAVSQLNEKLRF